MNADKRIELFLEKLQNLEKAAKNMQSQIENMRQELVDIQKRKDITPINEPELSPTTTLTSILSEVLIDKIDKGTPENQAIITPKQTHTPQPKMQEQIRVENNTKEAFNWEDFIGGNLINKIGILILIIGIGIFVKYAIDNNIITELGRVLLAYLAGLSLIGLSYYLFKKYLNYSAVLLSGGTAIMYFTTYFAYSYYGFLGQPVAFGLMFLITLYIVYEATRYNQEIIGTIGMVGAYLVPVLLGNKGGNIAVFFAYMSIINIGILYLAFYKTWRYMTATSFVITWAIYGFWFTESYNETFFYTALGFNIAFFAIFYVVILFNYINPKNLDTQEATHTTFLNAIFIANNLIFYAIGFVLFTPDNYFIAQSIPLGHFTFLDAILQISVFVYFYNNKQTHKSFVDIIFSVGFVLLTLCPLFYFEAAAMSLAWLIEFALLVYLQQKRIIIFAPSFLHILIIIFSLSVPFNFDSYKNLPLIVFTFETLALFVLQRKLMPKDHTLKTLQQIVFVITFLQILYFMGNQYGDTTANFAFLYNQNFAFLIFVIGLLVVGIYIDQKILPLSPAIKVDDFIKQIPVIALITLCYFTFYVEIYHVYLYQQAAVLKTNAKPDYTLYDQYTALQTLYLVLYTGLFASLLNFIALRFKFVSFSLYILASLAVFSLFIFKGIDVMNTAKQYLLLTNPQLITEQTLTFFRWLLYLFVAVNLVFHFKNYLFLPAKLPNKAIHLLAPNVLILILLSQELQFLLLYATEKTPNAFEEAQETTQKLGYSLLWGIYALGMVIYGISQKVRILRFGGIFLFFITLAKLFLLDIQYISTLSKIIAFIVLGVLLLLISFLYQKYKHIILAPDAAN